MQFLNMLNTYKNIFIVALIFAAFAAVVFYINSLKSEIKDLETKNLKTENKLAHEKVQSILYESTLKAQNMQIRNNKVERQKRIKELNEWKSKPAKIRYQVIYKNREVIKSNDCKDINNTINNIRTIDFSSL